MYPDVQFLIDSKLEVSVASMFLNMKAGGVDFGAGITKLHPPLLRARNQPLKSEAIIQHYVGKFYTKHKQALDNTKVQFQQNWDSRAKGFFN